MQRLNSHKQTTTQIKNIIKMSPKSTLNSPIISLRTIFITFSLISTFTLIILFINKKPTLIPQKITLNQPKISLKVFIYDLPRKYNYGLVQNYLTRNLTGSTPEILAHLSDQYPPYPKFRQSSAEYWLLGDLLTPNELRKPGSIVARVFDVNEADVVFVPFFGSLSIGMLMDDKTHVFMKKDSRNEDYVRQREVVDLVVNSDAWKISGGRNFVFVLTDPMSMLHVKDEIAPSILLVVDFGAWFILEPKDSRGNPPERIQHTQVSLLKDVIVPYTHLLPMLHLSENKPRSNLLYFKGGVRRQRGGKIRSQLYQLLVNEPDVVFEEGRPFAAGVEQSIPGMRNSQFCLDPAGDTPTSCRLFDAIQSLCIPVIISDQIELPFEGMIDYSHFSLFVSEKDALQPKWLINYLHGVSEDMKEELRRNMSNVQSMFVYENENPGGVGPIDPNGAVNQIWKKIYDKVPMIKEVVMRERRKKSLGVSIPLRCQCT